MGQAKNRGAREQRIAEAQAKMGTPTYIFINENRTENLLLSSFPCSGCGKSMSPIPAMNQVLLTPVRHAFQCGSCPYCGAEHVIMSAATKEDCILLEPVLKAFRESMQLKKGTTCF